MKPNMQTMRRAIAGDNESCRVMYLEFVNNFLTRRRFASYYGICETAAKVFLELWRGHHEEHCARIKESKA